MRKRALSLQDVQDWAVRNGFTPIGDGSFESVYEANTFTITLTDPKVRVHREDDREVRLLVSCFPSDLEICDDDMLRGAGLYRDFLSRFRTQERRTPGGGSLPSWFSPAMKTRVEQKVRKELAKEESFTNLSTFRF
jgi:hypothetical protein